MLDADGRANGRHDPDAPPALADLAGRRAALSASLVERATLSATAYGSAGAAWHRQLDAYLAALAASPALTPAGAGSVLALALDGLDRLGLPARERAPLVAALALALDELVVGPAEARRRLLLLDQLANRGRRSSAPGVA